MLSNRDKYMYKSMQTLSFRIRMGLLISGFSPSWHEERDTILKAYTNHTMLTPPNAQCILWCLRSQSISAGRDPKNMIWSPQFTVFSKSSNSQYISSRRDVIHSLNSIQQHSSPISCLWVYYDRWWLSYTFRVTAPSYQSLRDNE